MFRYENRRSSLRSLVAALLLVGAAVFCNGATASGTEINAFQYKSTLLQLIHTMGEILYTIDSNTSEAIAEAVTQIESITDEELGTTYIESLPLELLQQQIRELEPHLSAVSRNDQPGEIEIPPVTVRPPACADSSPEIALAASAVAGAAEIVLAATEYVCLQEDEGFNVTVACVALEVINTTAKNVYQGEAFCLSEQHAAREEALIELTRGIGKHLNETVDEVTLSSRASQQALDMVQADIDAIEAITQDIQDALDTGYSQVDSELAALEQVVANLGIDLNGLGSVLDDINFRSAVNLAELQDTGMRVADLQQRARDIRSDIELIAATVGDVNSVGTQLSALLESDWSRQQRDRIAADLGDAKADSPSHALPSFAGGELELAREIVIDTIFRLQTLGSVDTSEALLLVEEADTSYNAGQYPSAYLMLKQAYQTLDGLSEGAVKRP